MDLRRLFMVWGDTRKGRKREGVIQMDKLSMYCGWGGGRDRVVNRGTLNMSVRVGV